MMHTYRLESLCYPASSSAATISTTAQATSSPPSPAPLAFASTPQLRYRRPERLASQLL